MVTTEKATAAESPQAASLFNLPNKLTTLRLGLAILLFLLIWLRAWPVALTVFAMAAVTDWLDGKIARARGLVSSLGRVYDPLVDKILVCGAFIFLAEVRNTGLTGDAGLSAFMITVIVTREFLVTGLRGLLEQRGVKFGADILGKLKMVIQCVAIIWILLAFAWATNDAAPAWAALLRDAINWTTVALTAISGANYVIKAVENLA